MSRKELVALALEYGHTEYAKQIAARKVMTMREKLLLARGIRGY